MSTLWYYIGNGESKGPVLEEELRGLMRSGVLCQIDRVWHEGMANWADIKDVPELTSVMTSAPKFPIPTAAAQVSDTKTGKPFLSGSMNMLWAAAALGVGALVVGAFNHYFPRYSLNTSSQAILQSVSREMNKTLPKQIDKDLRLDSTLTSGNTLIYMISTPASPSTNINATEFINNIRPEMINNYKTNPQMKQMRESDVTLVYQFKGNDQIVFANITITTKD